MAWVDHTKVLSSRTFQAGAANPSGNTPTIVKLQSGDGSSVSIGQLIVDSNNQIRTIIAISGYGTDVVALSRSLGTLPTGGTTTYSVYNGMQMDLSPNPVTECRRFLYNAASDVPTGSTRTFYEKVFAVNNNTATAFLAASVQDAANTGSLPGSAALDLATATSANDTVAWVNRQTAPGSGYGSFVVQPSATAYGANSGNLVPFSAGEFRVRNSIKYQDLGAAEIAGRK